MEDLDRILKKNNNTFSLLDVLIKQSEISSSISKLKSNKASGLDNISNEMLKSGTTTLLPCLHKLFNLIFSLGFILGIGLQVILRQFSKLETADRQKIIEASL